MTCRGTRNRYSERRRPIRFSETSENWLKGALLFTRPHRVAQEMGVQALLRQGRKIWHPFGSRRGTELAQPCLGRIGAPISRGLSFQTDYGATRIPRHPARHGSAPVPRRSRAGRETGML